MIELLDLMGLLFKPHPWHGIPPGGEDGVYNGYVELTPTDTVKYEIDKPTGHLKVDRPQKYSNACPTLYGFIPQTCCGERVGALCGERTGRAGVVGDGDPLDICVITERHFSHGDVLVPVIPIGGLRMIEAKQADDKIVCVLKGDSSYGAWRHLSDVPKGLLDRLRHYFLTYKELPGPETRRVEIPQVYEREEALDVIARSSEDYRAQFGTLEERVAKLAELLRTGSRSRP